MKFKSFLGVVGSLSVFVLAGCSARQETVVPQPLPSTPAPQSSDLPMPSSTTFTARFEVYTNGTKRIFSEAKYHQQSTEVYLEAADPHLIQVKKVGITWSDFFGTLPFSLSKECLVTGTKQTFCNTPTHRLVFYLNDAVVENALERPIQPNDFLVVKYETRK